MGTKVSKAKQIDALIVAYNEAEAIAYSKLVKLFYILKSGSGNRRIEFEGSGLLTNCWSLPDRLDSHLHLNRFNRKISKWTVSDPKSLEIKEGS